MKGEGVKSEFCNNILYFSLSGEIDHHTAKGVRDRIDTEVYFYRPKTVTISLADVTFMDSSGLGLILGRYTKLKEIGSALRIENPNPEAEKILRLAGVDKLIEIVRTKKEAALK